MHLRHFKTVTDALRQAKVAEFIADVAVMPPNLMFAIHSPMHSSSWPVILRITLGGDKPRCVPPSFFQTRALIQFTCEPVSIISGTIMLLTAALTVSDGDEYSDVRLGCLSGDIEGSVVTMPSVSSYGESSPS